MEIYADPLDGRTAESAGKAQPGPYTRYLSRDALRGKRFGVPAFILQGIGTPFQGVEASAPADVVRDQIASARIPLQPATRAAFLKALDGLRAAGATVVFDDSILPGSFAETASRIGTLPYVREGTENFLRNFGPAQFHSAEQYQRAVGSPLPATIIGGPAILDGVATRAVPQATLETDPNADANVFAPRRKTLEIYLATLDRLHLDGYVYPATQMPPPDETMPQDGRISGGPHSDTAWVNMIGVPAVVVSGGFYPGGLPFGLEISARPWHDGDLLGYAYAYEQSTHHRHPPGLIESGLLPNTP